MTHESEDTFADHVEELLIQYYGEENVDRNHYLEETYRFADFWVDTGLVILAIEVENDFDSVLKGISQAYLYAAHDKRALPLVVVPKDHVENPEIEMLREKAPILELEEDNG